MGALNFRNPTTTDNRVAKADVKICRAGKCRTGYYLLVLYVNTDRCYPVPFEIDGRRIMFQNIRKAYTPGPESYSNVICCADSFRWRKNWVLRRN